MSHSEDPPAPAGDLGRRLDPDLAAHGGAPPAIPPPAPPAAIDTRRYRWAIGIFGLVLLTVLAIYSFASNGVGSPGVPPGQPLHRFVAPLAVGGPDLDANPRPRCNPAEPNPRGLNVCGRAPLVLAFFVTDSASCTRQVDALQALAARPRFRGIQFAAVAIHAGRVDTRTEIRRHGWTIPVAFDRSGAVGDLYGVEICPLVEVAGRGGIVRRRLIGEHWSDPATLAGQVEALRGG